MMDMKNITLNINGKTVKAEDGMTILQAAQNAGIDIPTLCYHEKLAPYGACRLCTVEIVKRNRTRLVASCAYPVEEGLVVKTNSERVNKIRRLILEMLSPLAPTGPLQSLAQKYGIKKSRFIADQTNCILCGLCVRYCAEIEKENAVYFKGRGVDRQIEFLPSASCIICRKCYSICLGNLFISKAETAFSY